MKKYVGHRDCHDLASRKEKSTSPNDAVARLHRRVIIARACMGSDTLEKKYKNSDRYEHADHGSSLDSGGSSIGTPPFPHFTGRSFQTTGRVDEERSNISQPNIH